MRGMKAVSSVVSIAILLAGAVAVRAQDLPGRGYAQGTLGFTTQPDAMPNHRISPPLGGTGFPGIAAAGGYFIRPSLAIEGEIATSEVSVEQGFHYSWSQEYTAALRVTTIDGSVRWKPGGVSPVELVVGGGQARVVHGTRDGIEFHDYPYPQGSRTPMADSSWGDWVWNIKGGADVVYPRASRAAFVSGARLRWRQKNSGDDYRGASAWAFDFGAGMRVRF
jgi:hypothetical protein